MDRIEEVVPNRLEENPFFMMGLIVLSELI